jgi:hypothetical protein
MTVEQYCELPEPGSFYYELHHGKLIQLSWPKMGEILVRGRLRDQLDLALDVWHRNHSVAVSRPPRIRTARRRCWLHSAWAVGTNQGRGLLLRGSRSHNRNEKIALCLENGCREFWVVDSPLRRITVSAPDGLTRIYRFGESIPLVFAENQALTVDSVFVDKARDGIV